MKEEKNIAPAALVAAASALFFITPRKKVIARPARSQNTARIKIRAKLRKRRKAVRKLVPLISPMV